MLIDRADRRHAGRPAFDLGSAVEFHPGRLGEAQDLASLRSAIHRKVRVRVLNPIKQEDYVPVCTM